jgi:hypothetical protein
MAPRALGYDLARMSSLEEQLRDHLRALDRRRLADEGFARQLYRALTNRRWSLEGEGAEDAVALSWGQAEALVNVLREEAGCGPLALAGSGGEGWLSDAADEALDGWVSAPVLAAGDERSRPVGGDSAVPPVPAWRRTRRFARRPLRSASALAMQPLRTPGGAPPQPSA